MYIVTGGAGFIGSAFVWELNRRGIHDILIVDELDTSEKWKNLSRLRYLDYLHKKDFLAWLGTSKQAKPKAIIHMGACSSTTEQNADYLMENNYHYTVRVAEYALKHKVRFLYASSGATYGDGALGYSDSDKLTEKLVPLNRYGYSKQLFDLWALRTGAVRKMAGIKFFNVFGPNEYHKGDMASLVFKAFHQVKETGAIRLFKSHVPEYRDGEQKRDFVYIKDCLKVMWWLLESPRVNGIYNLGTGQARTWNDLAKAVFHAMGKKPKILYIPMPESIRHSYQYFTLAEVRKLRSAGYRSSFQSLEESVTDYVQGYLMKSNPHLTAV